MTRICLTIEDVKILRHNIELRWADLKRDGKEEEAEKLAISGRKLGKIYNLLEISREKEICFGED